MTSKLLSFIPKNTSTATVIWLHGLGDCGSSWMSFAEAMSEQLPYVKWIFPDAPMKPVTINGGARMPAWFDIVSFDPVVKPAHLDEVGMGEAVATVNSIIENEISAGIPPSRIVIGGFSQGAISTLLTCTLSKHKLAATISCSGYFPTVKAYQQLKEHVNVSTPILFCHGEQDPIIQFQKGKTSAEFLKSEGYNTTLISYPYLAHSIDPKEMSDIMEFLKVQLPSTTTL